MFEGYARRCVRTSMESSEQYVSGCFLEYADLGYVVCPHATEVEYVCCMCEMLRTDILLERDVVDLPCCSLPHPFSSFYLIWDVDT